VYLPICTVSYNLHRVNNFSCISANNVNMLRPWPN
jgi:hypothetical protein